MAKHTDNEVLEMTNELYQQILADSPNRKKEDCKFLSHSPGRYCNASTHTNCNKCELFEPTIMAKFRRLLINTVELKDEIDRKVKTIRDLRETIFQQVETISYLRAELELRDKQTELAVEMARKVSGDGQITDGKKSETDTGSKEDVAGEVGEEG